MESEMSFLLPLGGFSNTHNIIYALKVVGLWSIAFQL